MKTQTVLAAQVDEEESRVQLNRAFSSEGTLNPKAIEFLIYDGMFFRAEYQLIDRNLVFHLFVRPEHVSDVPVQTLERWWLNDFAQHLDTVAQAYFDATAPRLQALYTQEVASWFLKAQGYGDLIDPLAFARGFLERLDGTLLVASGQQPASQSAMGLGVTPSSPC